MISISITITIINSTIFLIKNTNNKVIIALFAHIVINFGKTLAVAMDRYLLNFKQSLKILQTDSSSESLVGAEDDRRESVKTALTEFKNAIIRANDV
jgi:hypothetical protein